MMRARDREGEAPAEPSLTRDARSRPLNRIPTMKLQGPRTFLARPFWRDYIVAYLLIGVGFILTSPAAPVHRSVGVVILACGGVVLLSAVGWSFASMWRSRRGR